MKYVCDLVSPFSMKHFHAVLWKYERQKGNFNILVSGDGRWCRWAPRVVVVDKENGDERWGSLGNFIDDKYDILSIEFRDHIFLLSLNIFARSSTIARLVAFQSFPSRSTTTAVNTTPPTSLLSPLFYTNAGIDATTGGAARASTTSTSSRVICPTDQRWGDRHLHRRRYNDHHHLCWHRRRCWAAPLDNCVGVDANGGGRHGVYDEDGRCFATNLLGRSLDPKLGSLELLLLPPLSR